jgi:hypothetical protein
VKVIVRGIRGPEDVRGHELAVVLVRGHESPLPVSRWEFLGGSSVVVRPDGSVHAQYLRQPDPLWKQSAGPFPYVLPDVLTVSPGAYEAWFWLSDGHLVPSHFTGKSDAPPPRWFPEVWGEAGPGTAVLGTCHTTFSVQDERGATVRVWVPQFGEKTMNFARICPGR